MPAQTIIFWRNNKFWWVFLVLSNSGNSLGSNRHAKNLMNFYFEKKAFLPLPLRKSHFLKIDFQPKQYKAFWSQKMA